MYMGLMVAAIRRQQPFQRRWPLALILGDEESSSTGLLRLSTVHMCNQM
jgi:hypothetical protein